MSDLIEVVLENLTESNISKLLFTLVGKFKNIENIECSEEIYLLGNKISDVDIENFKKLQTDATIILKLHHLKVNDVILNHVLLRLVKYDNKYDIDFTFDDKDISSKLDTSILLHLHDYISELGNHFGATQWFAGVEPAIDQKTRFFTNYELGPLKL
ncbi:hypothetical protein SAMN05444141_1173 [Pseudovibrio denitrificans]|uniref:Uncharacterized protein n=1 Tax=Pseudovibrio denitrificans TaxID=258256 RepID=A0A1I7E0B2_9HYPH|nr:hypothetical protein [Pseudovibrio denitrificans]SFU17354.1 hypothetical protein SAMN05444141_1173 [Pseudovibrio denitrificans]